MDWFNILILLGNKACLLNDEATVCGNLTIIDIDVEVCCFTVVIEALGHCDGCVAYL